MNKENFIKINNLLNNIIKNNMLKENTKISYINCYYKLAKDLHIYDLNIIINNPDIYVEQINKLNNYYTKEYMKKIYICLLSLMNYNNFKINNKQLYNIWYLNFNEIKKELYNLSVLQIPTERQINSYIPWEDILEKYKLMKNNNKKYILISLLIHLPPRRQLDWFNVIVYNKKDTLWKPNKGDSDTNYINLGHETPYILLTNYKTARYYGKWYKKLEEPLLSILKNNYIEEESILFPTKQNEKYKTIEGFTSWTNYVIKSVFNKKDISMNTLRHSYISYVFKNNLISNLHERKILAKDMGHSIIENMMYDIHN